MNDTPRVGRVFVSYSHDNDSHADRVHSLVERLRHDRLTVIIDRDMLPGGPPEGWPLWCDRQVLDADAVLVVCTATYSERYDGRQLPGTGLGAAAEAATIRQLIYEGAGFNEKVRVILLDGSDRDCVPIQLKRYQSFQPHLDADYAALRNWLGGPDPAPAPAARQVSAVPWPSEVPDYAWQIAGRGDEFALFRKMITTQSRQRILLVRGDSNTGKTALLAELLLYARHASLTATFLDFKGCPMLDDLFGWWRVDLGQQVLRQSHAATGSARFQYLISDLQELALPLVLVFDTYEQASADAQRWLENQFLPRLDRAPAVVVVIGGQTTPQHDRHAWRTLTEFRELRPIRRVNDWLEYSQRRWPDAVLNHDHMEALTLATDGNPGQVSALLNAMIQALPRRGSRNELRRRNNET